jgi:hypothetical protein
MGCCSLVVGGMMEFFTIEKYTTWKCMDKPLQHSPNSTLGGLHMTQTIHDFDFVEWANPIKNSPKWSCNGKQWWFGNILLEMPLDTFENFPLHLLKPQGVVLPYGHCKDCAQG